MADDRSPGVGQSPEAEDEDEDDREWRFELSDLEDDEPTRRELETGDPAVENVVFFLLGVAATLSVVLSAAL